MITGIKISHVEATRNTDSEIRGLDINIGIDTVKVEGTKVEVGFSYTASYKDDVGNLKMNGFITTTETAKMASDINALWAKEQRLTDDFSEMVLNAVNFACGTNGVLVVRPVNLAPPLVPPPIQIDKGGAGAGAGGKGGKVAPSGRMD